MTDTYENKVDASERGYLLSRIKQREEAIRMEKDELERRMYIREITKNQ